MKIASVIKKRKQNTLKINHKYVPLCAVKNNLNIIYTGDPKTINHILFFLLT